MKRFHADIPGHVYFLKNQHPSGPSETLEFYRMDADGKGKLGTTNEAVIEVLIDRLNFLNKIFPCRENSLAITKLEEALMWLEKRTADRIERGVEGTCEA